MNDMIQHYPLLNIHDPTISSPAYSWSNIILSCIFMSLTFITLYLFLFPSTKQENKVYHPLSFLSLPPPSPHPFQYTHHLVIWCRFSCINSCFVAQNRWINNVWFWGFNFAISLSRSDSWICWVYLWQYSRNLPNLYRRCSYYTPQDFLSLVSPEGCFIWICDNLGHNHSNQSIDQSF